MSSLIIQLIFSLKYLSLSGHIIGNFCGWSMVEFLSESETQMRAIEKENREEGLLMEMMVKKNERENRVHQFEFYDKGET